MNEKEYETMNELQTEEFGGKKEKKSLLLILAILLRETENSFCHYNR